MLALGKILILSPHRDDEVLGCGGLLAQLNPKQFHIRYYNTVHPLVAQEVYDHEQATVIEKLGCTYSVSKYQAVNHLENYPISSHIKDIEQAISLLKPDTILIPSPDYNQDHRRIYEAAITATRPHDTIPYVRNVLLYEQPATIQTNRVGHTFIPHLFVPINLPQKLALFMVYKSQQRSYRSLEHVSYLAGLRGMQCNKPYAEAFMIVRMTQ